MTTRPHWSFWLISGLMLLWNVAGSANFIVQMNPEMIASYREHEQTLINNRPFWATAGFALAVFGGAIGCILLLLRKRLAVPMFILSFIGMAITMAHTLTADTEFSSGEVIALTVMPIAVALFLIWYAKYSKGKNWII